MKEAMRSNSAAQDYVLGYTFIFTVPEIEGD